MNQKAIRFIQFGAVLMALAVAFGAFGAHGLKKVASAYELEVHQTAVTYQFYHALALIGIGIIFNFIQNNKIVICAYLMIAGIVFFSGSLYLFVYTGIKPGLITPLGGILFIIAWIVLAFSLKNNKEG